jgi:hypothetical protein
MVGVLAAAWTWRSVGDALDTRFSGGIRLARDLYGVYGPQVVLVSVDSVRMTTARDPDWRSGVRTVSAEGGKNFIAAAYWRELAE